MQGHDLPLRFVERAVHRVEHAPVGRLFRPQRFELFRGQNLLALCPPYVVERDVLRDLQQPGARIRTGAVLPDIFQRLVIGLLYPFLRARAVAVISVQERENPLRRLRIEQRIRRFVPALRPHEAFVHLLSVHILFSRKRHASDASVY